MSRISGGRLARRKRSGSKYSPRSARIISTWRSISSPTNVARRPHRRNRATCRSRPTPEPEKPEDEMANRVSKTERKAWASEHFRGIENVLMPSFNPDLTELDEEGIRLDVRQSKRHGFFGSLCSVETGLTPEEKVRFVEKIGRAHV